MDEELELFYEDATDQLQFMENALLDAKDGTDDEDKIGEIFRAMHTIKGTAGMFEFLDIVSFTHVAESLLVEVRNKTVALDSRLATLFMEVKDLTSDMVEFSVNGLSCDDVTLEQIENLKKELLTSMPKGGEICVPMEQSGNKMNTENDLASIGAEIEDGSEVLWHISIRFDEDFFTSGMDILSIFRFFNKMGEILINVPILNKIPTLNNLDPLKTYIGFELAFQSDCSYDDILEIFEFVEDDVELVIFKADEKDKFEELFSKYSELKEILLDEGLYEEDSSSSFPSSSMGMDIGVESTQVCIPKQELGNESMTVKKANDVIQKKVIKTSTLRVDSYKIDLLINRMGEMVIQNSKLIQMAEDRADDDLEELAETMNDLLEEVRDGVMDMRMVQVKDSFNKFKRIVNDTSKKIGKDVEFVITGGETELDKTVVEKISDPLVHMLRNSIDHGVEMPQERVDKGKRSKGRVDLRAYPDSGTIVIEIEDDGKGLDKERILAKAIETGQVSQNANLSDAEIYKLIFAAGLSTAEKVSAISGRGVGMDVV
ncbi:MAG: Hpt domain-containing protein, partial [Arcobacteraceae bacterium]|nr:Hpt domain-containing protein [Arcobacteraceae bacterium]